MNRCVHNHSLFDPLQDNAGRARCWGQAQPQVQAQGQGFNHDQVQGQTQDQQAQNQALGQDVFLGLGLDLGSNLLRPDHCQLKQYQEREIAKKNFVRSAREAAASKWQGTPDDKYIHAQWSAMREQLLDLEQQNARMRFERYRSLSGAQNALRSDERIGLVD